MSKKETQVTNCCGSEKYKKLDKWVVVCKKCGKKTTLRYKTKFLKPRGRHTSSWSC